MSMVRKVETVGSISRCDLRGCRFEGLWKPVMLAPYGEKTAEASIEIHVCSSHKHELGDEFFKNIVYEEIAERIRQTQSEPPTRSACTVRWDKWNPGIIVLDA